MNKKRILVVEDDPALRLALQIRLKANDFEVSQAADAVTCFSCVQRQRPDLILLDLGLPGGDGYVVMQRLKRNLIHSDIPVIVLSARDREANEERSLVSGAEAFLQKPVENEVLLSTIREALGEDPRRPVEHTGATGRMRLIASG